MESVLTAAIFSTSGTQRKKPPKRGTGDMPMSETALKPCPFCGSVNIGLCSSFGDATTDENYVNVECVSCGAQGATKLGEIRAAEAWNKRAGGGAVNTELLAIVKDLAESNTYSHYKKLQQDARTFIQRMKH